MMTDHESAAATQATLESFYRGRKVLVVGADGFLGVNCVHALMRVGADLSILSRRRSPRAQGFAGQVFFGDLLDRTCVEEAVRGQSIVFDLAGISGAAQSNREPWPYLQHSAAHLALFNACAQAAHSPRVVFCSSRLVYGKPRYLPVDEEHPLAPESMYAVHKLTVEQYLRVLAATQGLVYCVLRLSNPYGPFHLPEARGYGIINHFIRTAANGNPIHIFGDGSQLRDYIFVDDVCTLFLLCAQCPGCEGEVFNVGGRQPLPLVEAARCIAGLAGGIPVLHEPWPAHEAAIETGSYCSDLRKLAHVINPPPPVSFEVGVTRTMAYYRQSPDLAGAPADKNPSAPCISSHPVEF